MKNQIKKKQLIRALKIGIGSSTAWTLAILLNLDNAAAAGSITLLTILTTKWETIRLSGARIVTYGISVCLAFILYHLPIAHWLMYAIYLFLLVLINEIIEKWKSTLSVNAVLGTHFFAAEELSPSFILNEFLLVLMGIIVAYVVMNLFSDTRTHKRMLLSHVKTVETRLQQILMEMAGYLRNQEEGWDVWEDLEALESDIKDYILDAYEYEGNTFHSHTGYYLSYFEMRLEQCMEFYSLHTEMKRVRQMPVQAEVIADYMLYLKDYIKEDNCPKKQLSRLYALMDELRKQPLPKDYEEFENRALLYHVLSQLEAFLEHKDKFIRELDEHQKKVYWKSCDGQIKAEESGENR